MPPRYSCCCSCALLPLRCSTSSVASLRFSNPLIFHTPPWPGFAEDDHFEADARRGACAFRNVNDDGDSASSSWGVAHLIYGYWCLFWSGITLCKLKEYHARHGGRNQGRPAAARQPVGPPGEGTMIHRWQGIGRHGGR